MCWDHPSGGLLTTSDESIVEKLDNTYSPPRLVRNTSDHAVPGRPSTNASSVEKRSMSLRSGVKVTGLGAILVESAPALGRQVHYTDRRYSCPTQWKDIYKDTEMPLPRACRKRYAAAVATTYRKRKGQRPARRAPHAGMSSRFRFRR